MCLNASVYYSLPCREGSLCRVGSLCELGRVDPASLRYDPDSPTAADLLPQTPAVLDLRLLGTQPGILNSFQTVFSRLFARPIELWRKDVAGYRIVYDEPRPMHLSVYSPLIIVVIDIDREYTTSLSVHEPELLEPAQVRHVLGHRVLFLERGTLSIRVERACLFMFEIRKH